MALQRSTFLCCQRLRSGFSIVLFVIRHGWRFWVPFGVTANPTAEWIARQIIEAFPWDYAPRFLIRNRDAAYGPVVVQHLRAMGIRERPIALRSPWQNAYVEGLIGSIRRECLDHMIVFGKAHLRRMGIAYAAYYNEFEDPSISEQGPRFIVRFSVSPPSYHNLSSAAVATNIAESNIR